MPTSETLPSLLFLWYEEHPDNLLCLRCRQPCNPDALVRTVCVQSLDTEVNFPDWSRLFTAFEKRIFFFDRHLSCISGIRYATISHVWDAEISDVQSSGYHSPSLEDDNIARSILSSVISLYENLERDAGVGIEMWYDYLSVPQWQDALKTRILSAIPEIFQRASFTLVYLEDVTPDIIHRLRHGHSVEERVSGITGICNAKWFSRVWTTMEFVRSSGLRVMIQGYLIQDGVEDVFFSELYQSWDRAVREVGDIHVLEAKIAKIGENKVPWNLGYPDRARKIRKEGKRIDFGLAFALLSRRGCRSSRDFYYALLGLVGSDLTAPPTGDPDEGCLKIQKACLAAGDLSPLLMTPRQGPGSDSFMVKRQGYYDAATFDLGGRTQDPLYPVQFSPSSGRPILTLARIGQVSHLQRAPHLGDHVKNLWKHIYHVIHVTGPDVEQFATSLGVRMFQMDQTAIDSILSDDTRRERLGKLLADWYDFGTFGPEQPPQEWAAEIGNLMYILRRPSWDSSGVLPQIHHVYALGGTVHGDMRFQGCLFGATCSSCHKMFIYRAAVYTRRSEAYGAIAYRIPGLCYSRDTTLPEGVGLLIKDAKIVGRLLWATPACECAPTIEKVSISLDTFNLQEK